MDSMHSQFGFKATVKMYKTRIKKWGLAKKNREKDMRAIVHNNKQRAELGKPTQYRIRDRVVRYQDVVRYWGRKGMSIDDVITQGMAPMTPETLDCFKPPMPSPITTPELLATPERILLSIRDYYKSSFASGTWLITVPRMFCDTSKVKEHTLRHLTAMSEQCIIACRLFTNSHFQEAGQTLISATAHIKEILLAEHPMTLTHLFALVMHILQQKRHEVALAILRQFSALGELLLGANHPLRCICWWLAASNIRHFEDVIHKCSQSMGDHFESIVGPMDRSTLKSRVFSIQQVDGEQDVTHQKSLLLDLLGECEAALGSLDIRSFDIRLSLASHYLDRQDYVEAAKLGRYLITHAPHVEMSTEGLHFHTEGLWIVANSQLACGEAYSAVVNLEEAIGLLIMDLNPYKDRAWSWLVVLEEWLVELGQLGTAAQVQARRRELLPDSSDAT